VAITFVEITLFANLRRANLLPPKPSVLEIGQNNYYCDYPLDQLVGCIRQYATDPTVRDQLLADFAELQRATSGGMPPPDEVSRILYALARISLRALLDYSALSAVDLSAGPDVEYRFDLNRPLPIERQFDIVLNLGTAEHIFNIAQCYQSMHERTRPGGLIVTCGPFVGGVDHGFYSIQPTFYYDLAAANGYEVLAVLLTTSSPQSIVQLQHREQCLTMAKEGRLPPNAGLYAVFRKAAQETPFATPAQGYYAHSLSPAAADMWLNMR
jgi:SAM-dependent methyltransferase